MHGTRIANARNQLNHKIAAHIATTNRQGLAVGFVITVCHYKVNVALV